MLDFYDLSEKITKVYFSDLKFELKNDCACRLIAESFPNTSFVSFLLYSSKNDSLNNFGQYFNSKEYIVDQSQIGYAPNRFEAMFHYLSIYQYLYYCTEKNKIKGANFAEFKSYQFFDNEQIENFSEFEKIKLMFLKEHKDEKYNGFNVYKDYKDFIKTKDLYNLNNPNTPSAKYFISLVDNKVDQEEKTRKYLFSTDIENKNKKLIRIFREDLGINVKENTIYLAIPLFAKDRYIGLIRILWHSKDDIVSIKSFLDKQGENELEKIANIIALHLGNSYNLEDLKKISYDGWNKYFDDEEEYYGAMVQEPIIRRNVFEELCESFRRTINCSCCILRLGSKRSEYPFIKGWAGTIQSYVDNRFISDHFKNKEILLGEVFQTPNNNKIKGKEVTIIGIQFRLNQQDLHGIKYLYVTENNVVNQTSDPNIIGIQKDQMVKDIFTSEVIQELRSINLFDVVILKIPVIKNGYLTFGNTRFRPFRSMDIDVLYPQIKNFGSEIYIRQSTSLDLRSDYLGGLSHELKKPLGLALLKTELMISEIEKLINAGFPISKVNDIRLSLEKSKNWLPRQFHFLLELMKEWLEIFNVENLFEKGILDLEPAFTNYNMCDTVSSFVSMFRELGKVEQRIGIIKNWDENLCIMINQNRILFNALLFVLMSNAIKYSFPWEIRAQKIEGYSQLFDKRSKGHIFVTCISNDEEYGYLITNWGKTIPPEYQESIFHLYVQCPPDENFPDQKDGNSMGIGLYYGHLYAVHMKADLSLKQDPFTKETIAKVVWKKY